MVSLTDSEPVLTPSAPLLGGDGAGRRRAVVAAIWDGGELVAELPRELPDPSTEGLAAAGRSLAAFNGEAGPPSVRVLEAFEVSQLRRRALARAPSPRYRPAMPADRPEIPMAIQRAVKMESGYRCAIPTCRQHPIQIHHIVPWAQVQKHEFENLIAFCGNCHALAEAGTIDRVAQRRYKSNLSLLNGRYSEMERRAIENYALILEEGLPQGQVAALYFETGMGFEFFHLLGDGLIREVPNPMGSIQMMGVQVGPRGYALTPEGTQFVTRWMEGREVEPEATGGPGQ